MEGFDKHITPKTLMKASLGDMPIYGVIRQDDDNNLVLREVSSGIDFLVSELIDIDICTGIDICSIPFEVVQVAWELG